jgi:glycerophosphoryl diester phosphodiesterase
MGVSWMTSGRRPVKPSVMAHRGGAALGAENSVETFALAAAAGANSVEVDLVQTADGQLVMLHDAFLTNGDVWRWVRDLTLDEITEVTGERPGTHLDLLSTCAELGLGVYAEVKAASAEPLDRLVNDIIEQDLSELVCVASFRADIVAHVARQNAVDTSWLFLDPGSDPLAVAQDLGCRFVHPCFDLMPDLVNLMDGEWMQRLWDGGRGVVSWNTVSPELMGKMAQAGVAAICTDDPRVVPMDLTQLR